MPNRSRSPSTRPRCPTARCCRSSSPSPTTPPRLDRQEPDVGPQYRSAIFPRSPEQERVARDYIAQLDGVHAFAQPIATRVETGTRFFPAEDYHQDFLTHNPALPYITTYDLPKIADLKRLFPARYREQAVLVSPARK
ncbi:MAG: peptide-methionine (S)-S-oxide reductase [Magnetospirillum sp.]|nr:peptide-methionine (S)-S-oxide reductase [Magnetospirillum sp.]